MAAVRVQRFGRALRNKPCRFAGKDEKRLVYTDFLRSLSRGRYFCSKSTDESDQSKSEEQNAPADVRDEKQMQRNLAEDSQGSAAPPQGPRISQEVLRLREAQKETIEAEMTPFYSPEFFPPMGRRSRLLDYLERQECFKRRLVLHIPEFYVGSILAVTIADQSFHDKLNRFVGICIERKNFGLGSTFKLRNIIDGEGIEILYEMYNPLIQKIEVIKLEKRLDHHLLYLRDALPEHSTIDPDMTPVRLLPGREVPLNDTKVILKPRPWHRKWEQYELQGIDFSPIQDKFFVKRWEKAQDKHWLPDYKKYDLLMMFPKYPLTEKERKGIERELDVHENELAEKKKKQGRAT